MFDGIPRLRLYLMLLRAFGCVVAWMALLALVVVLAAAFRALDFVVVQ